ncbi:MAG: hypothetical protein A2729_02880 [Candidatus Buchananbacteria bacterium RIFCSPHIGHO2_01_FULL_39_14]|uniref:Uncharacterized protein n=2 Tax=Candidatus Buchananiibacteriota TaxID=1817903 RepID=A0A1G1YW73_9BACT|nr:MAG: hypothetical protein A2729_02880 [Candidatus Buchananbacteria bacterium RIFCSPHIGHO2_01_FULL_39_14]OGY49430.1 MAG: hypothetical protein A3D39_02735 [Candidatus Buchananbacteria bacterium RIFCSPHIGHO2_02_FULL_39_17]OGY55647.1 MAG: hypothetical protein A2912_05570 [Candidatus Buchananbacteria bacterium RIFCSPLOWO2_01_FULL_40_23b]
MLILMILVGYFALRLLQFLVTGLMVKYCGSSSKFVEFCLWRYDRIRSIYWLGWLVILWILLGIGSNLVDLRTKIALTLALLVIFLKDFFVVPDRRM